MAVRTVEMMDTCWAVRLAAETAAASVAYLVDSSAAHLAVHWAYCSVVATVGHLAARWADLMAY